ncbi:MAG: hypothetical protein KKC43_03400 [Alphaproteobacteria bacterium]|nr:hypothetical protein [Alphaproteobacteria bacterium]
MLADIGDFSTNIAQFNYPDCFTQYGDAPKLGRVPCVEANRIGVSRRRKETLSAKSTLDERLEIRRGIGLEHSLVWFRSQALQADVVEPTDS